MRLQQRTAELPRHRLPSRRDLAQHLGAPFPMSRGLLVSRNVTQHFRTRRRWVDEGIQSALLPQNQSSLAVRAGNHCSDALPRRASERQRGYIRTKTKSKVQLHLLNSKRRLVSATETPFFISRVAKHPSKYTQCQPVSSSAAKDRKAMGSRHRMLAKCVQPQQARSNALSILESGFWRAWRALPAFHSPPCLGAPWGLPARER